MSIEIRPHFVHRFHGVPGSADKRILLLLHGTGGDENDLIPLGRSLAPETPLLSPRGKELEDNKPRFFRRLAEGVFDLEDLRFRATELANFVTAAVKTHAPEATAVIAVGYSNGANIAGAVLLLHPEVLAGAILFRPMVPIVPDTLPDLSGKPVFISAGRSDLLVPAADTERLAELLRFAGANVTIHWADAGHALTNDDVDAAREWFSNLPPPP